MSLQQYFSQQLEEREAAQAVRLLEAKMAQSRISSELDITRARHARRRNRRVDVTSGVPDEILQLIFVTAKQISWRPVELRVSQVSSHWRNVATHTSELWTDIEVSVFTPTGSLEAYVTRSGRRPLAITIDLWDSTQRLESFQFCSIIRSQMFRCRSLEILSNSSPLEDLYPLLLQLHFEAVPLLESLTIGQVFYNRTRADLSPPSILRHLFPNGAPQLTSARYQGIGMEACRPPLHNLTTLFIHDVDSPERWNYGTFKLFMAEIPRLEYLSVAGDPCNWDYLHNARIDFPSLRALRICYDDSGEDLPRLWIYANAPRLEILHIVGGKDWDIVRGYTLLLGRNPFPSLKSLMMDGCKFNHGTFKILTATFPSIKHLTYRSSDTLFVKALATSDVWPEIESVALWSSSRGLRLGLVQTMLKARIACRKPIQKLVVANEPPTFPSFFLRDYVRVECTSPPLTWPEWDPL